MDVRNARTTSEGESNLGTHRDTYTHHTLRARSCSARATTRARHHLHHSVDIMQQARPTLAPAHPPPYKSLWLRPQAKLARALALASGAAPLAASRPCRASLELAPSPSCAPPRHPQRAGAHATAHTRRRLAESGPRGPPARLAGLRRSMRAPTGSLCAPLHVLALAGVGKDVLLERV